MVIVVKRVIKNEMDMGEKDTKKLLHWEIMHLSLGGWHLIGFDDVSAWLVPLEK